MCGIAGILTKNGAASPRVVAAMQAAIAYRGRDAQRVWHGEGVWLMHSRLSIIDVAGGSQPMQDAFRRYTIVFNGEIYNYLELREAYARQGSVFRTDSDTEVVLEGFRLKREAVCRDLNGMFAFAIWDAQEQTLFIARDRLGKKPIYWTECGGDFFFASTLDAFKAVPGWTGTLSKENIAVYTLLGAFPHQRTIYKAAFALPGAHYAYVRPGDASVRPVKYWQLSFSAAPRRRVTEYLEEEYEQLLTDAIRLRLRSDVPLALTFSGGVDSGTIAALCAKELGRPLRCYTIDYHTDTEPSQETQIAREVAELLGLDWTYIHYDYHNELLDDLPEAYRPYDQPCHQLALVYAHRLYQTIKPHATVVLSGNGCDELFTGYIGDEAIYRKGLILQALAPLRPVLRHLPLSPFLRLPLHEAWALSLRVQARLFERTPEVRDAVEETSLWLANEAEAAGAFHALDLKMLYALSISSTDSNFRIPDISGMMAQVEVRSPFLDYRLVEFAARLPYRYRVRNPLSAVSTKYLPKRFYQRYVPCRIALSRKKGMGWNLRWDRSIAVDKRFALVFSDAWKAIESVGIDSRLYREAWQSYIADIRAGKEFSPSAKFMMTGLMLGAWLQRR